MVSSRLVDGPLNGRTENAHFNGPENPTKYMQYNFTLDGESGWVGYSYLGEDAQGNYLYGWSHGYGKV